MLRTLTILLAGAAVLAAAPAPLAFDRVFAAEGEPAALHYRVAYRSGGAVHHMELWRDGDRRIARVTDGMVRSYASHKPGDPDYRLTMLDARRHIRTDVERTNLYRIGSFVDWYDLAHGLRHPAGRYTLTALDKGPATPAPAAPCRWYSLAEGGRQTQVCWSTADRIPMLIVAGGRTLVWRVLAVDTAKPAPARFAINDKGYVRVDANEDMAAD